jgi:RNA polymerase sigma factor (sigma-70 family)
MANEIANEIELLGKCLKGSNDAFGGIVAKYQSLVCAITYSATGDVATSEDMAQEVFVNAWKNLRQLKDLSKFRAWLCSIARNVVCNHLRDKKRDIAVRGVPMDSFGDISYESSEPVDRMISREQEAVVREALGRIPEEYREPLVLFYREEQSVREVAAQLELSEEAVRTRLSRARLMLKNEVEMMIEKTIGRSRPGKAFTAAVMAGIAGIGVGSSGAASIAGSGTGAGAATTAAVGSAIMAGLTAKILTVAAVIVVGVGTVVVYKHFSTSTNPALSNTAVQKAESAMDTKQELNASSTAMVADANRQGGDANQVQPSAFVATDQQEKFVFKPKGVLSGLVTDAKTGAPVKDAMVTISGASYERKQVDANGFYFFEKVKGGDGTYSIEIQTSDYVGISDWAESPKIELKNDLPQVKHFGLERACKIAIKVTDERGKPIADTSFSFGPVSNPQNKSSSFSQAKTDANGFAIVGGIPLSSEPYQIVARRDEQDGPYRQKYLLAPGYIDITLQDPTIVPSASIVLEEGVKVRGYATYEDGTPASDLWIYPTPEWWRLNLLYHTVKIDPNGYFEFTHIVADRYKISVIIPTVDDENQASGSIKEIAQVDLPPDGNLLVLKVSMKSPQSMEKITGKMRFINGKPDYVNVNAHSVNSSGVQNSTSVRPSSEETSFVVKRLEPGIYQVTFSGGVEQKIIKDFKVPGPDIDVELVCRDKRTLNGMVMDAMSRQPVKKFRARLAEAPEKEYPSFERRWESWVDFTGEDGKFSLKPMSSNNLFYVEVTDSNGWGRTEKIDINEQVVVELVKAGSVRGVVVDESGKGLDGATVTAASQVSLNMSNNLKTVSETGSTKTLGGGVFTIKNLPCGKDSLKVTHPDYCNEEAGNIEIKAGQATDDVKIVLHKGGTVEGHIYDESGEPAASASIKIYSSIYEQGDPAATAVTDANGFYRVTNLPEKMCKATRRYSGQERGVIQRNFMPSRSRATWLDFGGKTVVQGKLALPDEESGNRKLILTSGGPHISDFICIGVTKADGSFSFVGVPAGKYSIYIERDELRSNASKLAAIPTSGQDQEIGIIPRQDACILTIHVGHTAGVRVLYLLQEGAAGTEMPQYLQVTDANVPQVFKNVVKGDYKLVAYGQDGFQIKIPVQVREARQEITLELPYGTASVYGKISGNLGTHLSISNADETISASMQPKEDGSYKIENLPAGTYSVQYMSDPKNKTVLHAFNLADGASLALNLYAPAVDETGTLTVFVADGRGFSISDADVRVEGNGQTCAGQHVIGAGYRINAKPGKYVLKVSRGGKTLTQNVIIEAQKVGSASLPKTVSIRFDK